MQHRKISANYPVRMRLVPVCMAYMKSLAKNLYAAGMVLIVDQLEPDILLLVDMLVLRWNYKSLSSSLDLEGVDYKLQNIFTNRSMGKEYHKIKW